MAVIRFLKDNTTLTDAFLSKAFLAHEGIGISFWWIPDSESDLLKKNPLTPSECQHLTSVVDFDTPEEGKRYAKRDVLCLTREDLKTEKLLLNFDREHFHEGTEMRIVLAGKPTFYFNRHDGSRFALDLEPGDGVVIPARRWHWFGLRSDSLKMLRFFERRHGWVSYYRDESIYESDPPAAYAG